MSTIESYKERRTAQLVAELHHLRTALETIKTQYGQVCDTYETCEHKACAASYGAWATADNALREWEQMSYARAQDDGYDEFVSELAAAKTDAERAQILEDNK